MFLSAALIGLYAPDGIAQELPLISVVANHDSIEEGGKASFALLSSDRPATPFRVSISISQTGAVAAPGETGRKLVTIDTRGRGNITVATTDDRTNEPTGSIRVTTNPGQGYRVPAPGDYRSASTAVRDNDLPAILVQSGSKISEGGTARFTLSARPRPTAPIDVNVSVAESGKFASEGQLGVRIVTIATNGQGTLEVRTDSDTTDEDDGSITASVGSGQGYSVGTPAFASVDVTDGGVPTPRISIRTQSSVIVEGGTATFELTANPRPASSMNVQVEITDSGSFASQGEVGTRTVTIGTNGRASFDVATENDLVTESDGTLTAKVLRGTGYLVASSGSVSVTVRDESVQVSVRSDGDIVEGSTATFTLIANPAPPESLAVEVNITESGDFLTGGAYTETVTVGTDGRGILSVDTLDDKQAEDDGAITATLVGSDSYAVGSPARATARVSDLTPTITIAAGPSIIEGDTAIFTLTASPAPERSLTVSLDVREEVPGRFTSSSEAGRRSVLVYPDGSGTLEVRTDVDETDDGNSGDITATILADDAGGYYRVGSPAAASLRVNDNDHGEGRVAVSVANAEIQEGARNGEYGRTQIEFAVTLNKASDKVVTAHFSTRSFEATGEKSAATAGSDYRDSSWVPMWVQFEPGDTETVLNVVVYDDDEYEELPEAFELAISRVYGAEIADGSAIGTILPDPLDAPRGTPVVTITVADGAIVTEGEPATFKLTAKPAPENDLVVDITVSDDGDYLADADQGARTVVIPGADRQEYRAFGDSVTTLVLPTVDDTEAEDRGKIRVRVELAVDGRYDASEAPYEAEVDVLDNDAAPPVASACVPAQLRSDVERYAGETHHGRAHVDRWMTVLAAFGDNNGYTPMSGAEARQMMARYRVVRWRPVVDAIECLERGNAQSAAVRGPAVSVSDAKVKEAAGAAVAFVVTLSHAASDRVTVDYQTWDGSAQAGTDYTAESGRLTFSAGESQKTLRVAVIDDAHDEGKETFTLALSNASGAWLKDAVATGTIENTDLMPAALLARFGRATAEQVVDHVEQRMAAPRKLGFRARFDASPMSAAPMGAHLSGHGGGSPGMPGQQFPMGGAPATPGYGSSGSAHGGRFGSLLPGADPFANSELELNQEQHGGIVSVWSRSSQSYFGGMEGALSLNGDVRTTMLGADYSRGPLIVGLSVGRTLGLGGYGGESAGQVTSSMTGFYPWLGYQVNDRVSVWGVTGYGTGALSLTPDSAAALDTGMSMAMAAAGTRGELLGSRTTGGFALAFKADALWVGAETALVDGAAGRLNASQARVTRVRTALEGSRDFIVGDRVSLTPSVEVGLRQDGGDAETGTGMDVGGGIAFTDSVTGLSLDVRMRTLVVHQAEGFVERGMSLSFGWDPTPSSPLGLTARVAPSWGGSAMDGADALWRSQMAYGMGSHQMAGAGGQVNAEIGYGLPAGRFVGTPSVGLSTSQYGRDYRLGYRLGLLETGARDFGLDVSGTRRESTIRPEPDYQVVTGASVTW